MRFCRGVHELELDWRGTKGRQARKHQGRARTYRGLNTHLCACEAVEARLSADVVHDVAELVEVRRHLHGGRGDIAACKLGVFCLSRHPTKQQRLRTIAAKGACKLAYLAVLQQGRLVSRGLGEVAQHGAHGLDALPVHSRALREVMDGHDGRFERVNSQSPA